MYNGYMSLFSKQAREQSYLPPDADLDALLREYYADIEQLVEAIMQGEPDIDLRLADLVENATAQARIAIVEKLRQMIAERSEEKAKQLDQLLQQQKLLEHHRQKRVMQAWLAYFMSQETLRKLREAFLSNPGMKRDVEHMGQELAKKGVLQNMQPGANRNELGGLSANVNAGRDAGKGQDKGR